MNEPVTRDYFALLKRLKKALPPNPGHFYETGMVSAKGQEYPLIKIILGEGNPKRVLLSAGIHGDEPAGVETICEFLEKEVFKEFCEEWEVTILPCLNPSGYAAATRTNHEEKDLNRLFKTNHSSIEVKLAQTVLNTPFDLTLELHEDIDSKGFYIYMKELPETDPALGRKIINEAAKLMPINNDSEIEGVPADRGLLARLSDPEKMEWWPMALYAAAKGSKTCFTIETSTFFPFETRIACHRTAIKTALRNQTKFL